MFWKHHRDTVFTLLEEINLQMAYLRLSLQLKKTIHITHAHIMLFNVQIQLVILQLYEFTMYAMIWKHV